MNILIVDDEDLIVQDLVVEVKELYPNAVIDVSSNAEAVLVPPLSKKEFDIALLDIDMPGMDGLVLAKKLTERLPSINIIFANIIFIVIILLLFCYFFIIIDIIIFFIFFLIIIIFNFCRRFFVS